MPGAHRDLDTRFCGAITQVTGQSSVYVNNRLWAVEGDLDDHCNEGGLVPVYGAKNVYIENKLVICAVGDTADSDHEACFIEHPPGATDPLGHSTDVGVYGGAAGGGS